MQTPPTPNTLQLPVPEAPYSGIVQTGWNPEGSYDRLQFSGTCSSIREINDIINQGLSFFMDSPQTRLDLRISTEINHSELRKLSNRYSNLEIAAIFQPDNETTQEVTICLNKAARAITNEQRQAIFSSLTDQKARHDNDRESFLTCARHSLSALKEAGHSLVSTGFTAPELHELWGQNFGWTTHECQELIENSNGSEVYGIRSNIGELIAAVLISPYKPQLFETTEWAVANKHQKQGLIKALLPYAHALHLRDKHTSTLFAHLRAYHSTGPGLQAGITINTYGPSAVLSNHVTVDRDLRSFLLAQADATSYPDELYEYYSQAGMM